MTREQLEHIIRAASSITNEYEFIIIGSQSILGDFPNAPFSLLQSMEADIYPLNAQDKADLIDGTIGEYSLFHETYGYYAQGVSSDTAVLPNRWEQRLIAVRLKDSVGYCLDVHDLAISKLVASREKDLKFIGELIKQDMVDTKKLFSLINFLPISKEEPNRKDRVCNTLKRIENTMYIQEASLPNSLVIQPKKDKL